jgi:ABC-type Fe3+ transport system permease subunit
VKRPVSCASWRKIDRKFREQARLSRICLVMGGLMLAVILMAVMASLITYWLYNLPLSLRHYDFGEYEPNGWAPYFASISMSALAALIGTAVVIGGTGQGSGRRHRADRRSAGAAGTRRRR